MIIDADGKTAVQEVRRLEKAQKDAGKASDQLATKSRGAQAGVKAMAGAAGAAEAQVDTMAQANQRAAGSMSNLVAQGNDVVTMLIAGQNPMQLAIQQGTQINQVWGQMGVKGTGAFKAIGGALMSMLSPINLITIGSIAAAGAMLSWFSSGREEAATFQDQMDALESAMSTYSEAADAAEVSTDDLSERFGAAANEVRRLLVEQRDAARRGLKFKIKAVIEADLDETSLDLPDFDFGDQRRLSKEFDLSLFGFDASARRERQALINEVLGDYAQLAQAAEGSVSDQVAAVEQLLESYGRAARASGEITKSENDRIKVLQDLLIKLQELAAQQSDVDASTISENDARLQYYQSRIQAEEYLKNARADELASLEQIYGVYVRSREQSDAQLATAQDMLAELQAQSELQQLIAVHGEDSAEVAAHQAEAERNILVQKLEALDVAESIKAESLATYDNTVANEAATANWSAAMAGVAAEVRGILSALASIGGGVIANASKRVELEALRAGESVADARMAAAKSQIEAEYQAREMAATNWIEKAAALAEREVQLNSLALDRQLSDERSAASKREALANRKSRGAAAARLKEAKKEREAVTKLIQSLEDQLAILRETDPVQKEMLRNREALKGATAKEREAVEDLIATRLREEEVLDNHKALTGEIKDIGYDLFTSATQGADALEAAALRAADAIAEMVFQAILLGEGPLGGLIGGGGLLTGFADALSGALTGSTLPAKAEGGMIYGPGGGASDDVLMWGSFGEFVVNANATAKHRPLLEQINAGGLPGYAAGGMIPAVSSGPASTGADKAPTIIFENNSSAQVQQEMREERAADGGRAFRFVLSDQVGQAMAQPGGGARRTLRNAYGVKPRGTNR